MPDAPRNDLAERMIRRVLESPLEATEVLRLALGLVQEATGAERGFLVLLDETGQRELEVALRLAEEEMASPRFELSRGLIERVARTAEPALVDDALAETPLAARPSIQQIGLRSALVAPIPAPIGPAAGGPIGVVYLDHRARPRAFDRSHRDLVVDFVGRIAPLFDKVRLERRMAAGAPAAVDGAFGSIVGRSEPMARLFGLIERVAPSRLPVLIEGESGTGKELVARTIHDRGPCPDGPFVAVNCAALTETLLEGELFGVVRGAYTGADQDREGLLVAADGGTLFLDEVAEMSPGLQAKLLRVVEESRVRPVGAGESRPIDVRILSATNRPLAPLCQADLFRSDLFFRLAVVRLEIPPLRQRKGDLPALAARFAGKREIDPEAMEILLGHDWPGNVRELKHVLERAIVLSGGPRIEAGSVEVERMAPADDRRSILRAHPELSPREADLVALVRERRSLDARSAQEAMDVSRATILRDLARLVEMGLIGRRGRGRSVRYVPPGP